MGLIKDKLPYKHKYFQCTSPSIVPTRMLALLLGVNYQLQLRKADIKMAAALSDLLPALQWVRAIPMNPASLGSPAFAFDP